MSHCSTCTCRPQAEWADSHDDPRWRFAQAEYLGSFPELDLRIAHALKLEGITRAHEIEIIYEMGHGAAHAPSFPASGWRSPILKRGLGAGPVDWDPARHNGYLGFWRRIVCYQIQLGTGRSPREVVAALAASRREWHAVETARLAVWLLDRHKNRSRLGAQRYLKRLKDAVMATGGPCTYCGGPNPRSVDHIVPTSRGGIDHPSNLTIACLLCNSQKRNQTPAEWAAHRVAAGLSPFPRHVEKELVS